MGTARAEDVNRVYEAALSVLQERRRDEWVLRTTASIVFFEYSAFVGLLLWRADRGTDRVDLPWYLAVPTYGVVAVVLAALVAVAVPLALAGEPLGERLFKRRWDRHRAAAQNELDAKIRSYSRS